MDKLLSKLHGLLRPWIRKGKRVERESERINGKRTTRRVNKHTDVQSFQTSYFPLRSGSSGIIKQSYPADPRRNAHESQSCLPENNDKIVTRLSRAHFKCSGKGDGDRGELALRDFARLCVKTSQAFYHFFLILKVKRGLTIYSSSSLIIFRYHLHSQVKNGQSPLCNRGHHSTL